MTLNLTLKPEIEAGLLANAEAAGLRLEEYIQRIVDQAAQSGVQDGAQEQLQSRREAVLRMLEFGEKHRLNLGEPITRATLHEGHRC